jgi:predicted transcriptional regulator
VAIATGGNSNWSVFPDYFRIATSGKSRYDGRKTSASGGQQPMTFAEKLRELRDASGLSEAKLAEASGVPFASVHEYGLGRRKPSFAAAVKIARALGVSCEAFADCEDVAGESEPNAGRPKKSRSRKGK